MGPRVGPSSLPFPDGPRPGCPGRVPQPSRGSGAPRPGPAACPSPVGPRVGPSSLTFPDGPRPGCPAGPRRPPRPSRVVRGPWSGPPTLQPALPRWAPARVSGGPGEASPAVPGGQGPQVGPSHPPACPATMGPGPGVRGGFPGRPGGQGPGSGPPSLPCPDGPRPVPQGPRRLRGLRGLLELKQSASRWPHREAGASGHLPRWFAMARPDGRAAREVPGVRGPGSGPPLPSSRLPCPMGPGPGVRQAWVSGEASPATQGPRVGSSHPPGCPSPMGPSPGVRGARGGLPCRPGGQGPRVGPSHPPACPAPVGPGPGVRGGFPSRPGGQGPRVGPSQPALPRWAPAGSTGTPSAPRAKAECVQMAALRARPSGLTEKPRHLVALRAGLLWRVQMAGLPRKSR
ncbi:hypothetical protein NDU88_006209 [Pleurodeles waltl]|uniref:Uncharacterized protein n=1 Tax=Pleurodeles waltl TaxID=8319 RepID=A0AAV7ULR9_PLEWA|nr:hypothetical protein NDU88_006209 [Pleurodeles waltl]